MLPSALIIAFLLVSFNFCSSPKPTFSLANFKFWYSFDRDCYLMGLVETQSNELYFFDQNGQFELATNSPNDVELNVGWPFKNLGLLSILKILQPHYNHLDWPSFTSTAMKMDIDCLKLLPAEFWNNISSHACVELIMNLGEKQAQLDFIEFLYSMGVRTSRFRITSSIHGLCYGASEGDTLDYGDRMFVVANGGGSFIITHQAWKKMKLHVKYFQEYERIDAGTPLFLYSDAP